PGGLSTPGDVQVKVGCGSPTALPPESARVVSVAHAGTTRGPMRGVLAVAPVAAVAYTRQYTGAPGLSGRRRSYDVTSVSVVSTMLVSAESRAIRSRYCTGVAKTGTVSADQANVGVIVLSGETTGMRAVRPAGNTALCATSGRPQPRVLSG